jgi:hypothetical protein
LELEFKAALEGDKNLPMVRPTLASTLDEIVRETERFLVIDHDDAQSIALSKPMSSCWRFSSTRRS